MIAHCIQEIESKTTAEVVLVLRRFSGNYKDFHYLFGGLCAFAVLIFLLLSPTEFPALSFPLPVVLSFLVGASASNAFGLPRWFSRASRKRKQVEAAARACFVARGIEKTTHRQGILVYFSLLEGRAEILPDVGATGALPPERIESFDRMLAEACERKNPGRAIAAFLRSFGVHLGRELPRSAGEGGEDELSDVPDLEGSEAGEET